MERSSGILMPIFSLPSRYGIGSLGKSAYAFADFLRDAGQHWWQILPVGPTAAGDSPYTAESSFAGNPFYIDLDLLVGDGLLTWEEAAAAEVPPSPRIDYAALHRTRLPLLRKAFERGYRRDREELVAFLQNNRWAWDYALYRAAKEYFNGRPWQEWPAESLRRHEPAAIAEWETKLAEDVAFHGYLQYLFYQQWDAFRKYVNSVGVKLIGDMPIYVSLDSADVWSEPQFFQLSESKRPTRVAGVPPDYFSADGQLWGNPLYDWDAMKRDGYGWWIRRVEGASRLCDALRLDHFRGFESYWSVPATAKTAREGRWEKGPGMDLLRVLTSWFNNVTYIAEDLGALTPEVHQLRNQANLPGMRVLEFAFSAPDNAYLPHNHVPFCICYTGTHDNNTAAGWYADADEKEKAYARTYLHLPEDVTPPDFARALIRAGSGSVAQLFISQLQDWLGLGSENRINVPGVAQGSWRWKMPEYALTPALAEEMRELTWTYGRCSRRELQSQPLPEQPEQSQLKEAEQAEQPETQDGQKPET